MSKPATKKKKKKKKGDREGEIKRKRCRESAGHRPRNKEKMASTAPNRKGMQSPSGYAGESFNKREGGDANNVIPRKRYFKLVG